LLARNPAENFGRDWWVVDMAVDRGAIRHDLFPKRSGLPAKARIKGALTIGSKDIVLECTVPTAPVTARAIYPNPADALWRSSISDLAENGFVRSARHPD
jgi:hypothetical protein